MGGLIWVSALWFDSNKKLSVENNNENSSN